MPAVYQDLVGVRGGAWQARKWAMLPGGGEPSLLAVDGVAGIYEGPFAPAGRYLLEKGWGWFKNLV